MGILTFFHGFRSIIIGSSKIQNEKKIRSLALDVVRGFAICGIVMIHIDSYLSYFHPEDELIYFSRILANLSRFSVPAFIFSSGIYLSFKGYPEYFQNRWKSLILPYIIFCIPGYFMKYPMTNNWQTDFLFRFITGSIFEPYYYVPLLLQMVFIFLFFFRVEDQISILKKRIILILALILNFLSNHFFPSDHFWKTIQPLFFGNFIFFFIMGICGRKIFKDTESYLRVYQDVFFKYTIHFLILLFIFYVIYLTIYTKTGFINHLLFYPTACFLILLYHSMQWSNSKNRFVIKIISLLAFLGKNSLFIFLVHPIFIHILHGLDPYLLGGKILCYPIILILNIAVPLGVGELYKIAQEKLLG